MDGGRVFRALLARTRPYGQATRIAARVGVIFALVSAVVGVLSFNVILLFVALFVYGAATSEPRTTALEDLLAGLTVADVMTRDPRTISATSTVAEFVDQGTRETTPVADVMAEEPLTVRATADAFDTLVELGTTKASYALVEEDGAVVGVLSRADYASALELRRGIGTVGERDPPLATAEAGDVSVSGR